MYAQIVRPLLFLVTPEEAHATAFAALAPFEYVAPLRALAHSMCATPDPRLVVRAMGLEFPSPLGVAGGFDKNALRPRALAALGFGHLELGTVTARAQDANPEPNLFRLPRDRALVNRLGFPNEGAVRVVERLQERGVPGNLGVPLGISIGKSRAVGLDPIHEAVDDYRASFREARKVADYVVVNVSSPNTKDLRRMQGGEIARTLLSALARDNADGARSKLPLLVKIAPDLSDAELEDLLAVCEETHVDGVVATNTTLARTGLATDPTEVAQIGAGGLSGPPLRTRALEVVARVRARLGPDITVVGVGGIETADDAAALIRAGANLVQMYTGFIYEGPFVARNIARGLLRRVEEAGVESVSDLARLS